MALASNQTKNNCKFVIQLKHNLDARAELGWHEFKTTAYIKKQLQDKPLMAGFGDSKTGLLYRLGDGKKAILLRADIDALSSKQGVVHICGHSSHTAALMGVYYYTKKHINQINNNDLSLYFLFQPSEETYPSGAKAFIDQAAQYLDKIHFAFATHVRPLMPLGQIGIVPGPVFARGDYMEITVYGKQVHVKNAPEGIDAIEIASHLILFIKKIQQKYPGSLRINIGTISGGRQPNTVADEVLLKGDIRLKQEKDQSIIKKQLQTKINRLQSKYRSKIKFDYYSSYPALQNNPILANELIRYLQNSDSFKIISGSSLFSFGCEDFSYISSRIPSVYVLVGTGDKYDIHDNHCTISDKGTMNIYRVFLSIINWWIIR